MTPTPPDGRPTGRRLALNSIAAVFVAIVVVLLILQHERAMILADVRAYVGGEGLYAKGQKRAVIQLFRYAASHDEARLADFREALAIPQGDRDARIELSKAAPDLDRAAEAFVRGHNHPDEVRRMARFFLNFQSVSYVAAAIRIWEEADREVAHLDELAERLHAQVIAGDVAPPSLNALLEEIAATDERVSRLEDAFSSTLAEGARFVQWVTELVLLALAAVLLFVGVLYSRRVARDARRAEAAIRTLNESLEGRVAARTAELRVALDEMEAFSYSISHDLRTPLRAMNGYASMLLQRDGGAAADPQARTLLERIAQNAVSMARLIDGLLDFARLGRAPLSIGPVDMAALVRAVVAEQGGLPDAVPTEISIGLLPPASGDATLLRQVWVNLISNARKFSSRSERPRIEISAATDAGEVVYSVRDNGVGFDMAFAGKLFKVFERLHATSDYPGTGVGLALVRRIVERHHGRVWAEASPGAGAVMRFALPRA